MISTRRLVIAATALALTAAMPWQTDNAWAGDKQAPATPVLAVDEPAAATPDEANTEPAVSNEQDAAEQAPAKKPSSALPLATN